MRIAALPRPTPGVVWLSLFVDAGARDAEDPQTASMVANLMALATGQGAVGVAYPDAIEVNLPCTRKKLPACLKRLARSLSMRKVDAKELRRAQIAFEHDRDEAHKDERFRVVVLALQDLLADRQAAGFMPLGDGDHQTMPNVASIETFMHKHLGTQHATLVVSGDISQEQLTPQVKRAFGNVAQSASASTNRAPAEVKTGAGKVATGTALQLGLVFFASSPSQAYSVCQTFLQRLKEHPKAAELDHCLETPIREGAIATVTARASSVAPLIHAVARAHEVVAYPTHEPTAPAVERNLASANRNVGLRLGTQDSSIEDGQARLGVGLLAPEAEYSQPALMRRLADVLSWAQAPSATEERYGRNEATLQTAQASARIFVQPREGERAAIVVSRAPGAAQDPLAAMGRAALLATLASSHCDGLSSDALAMQLRTLDAHLVPIVTPSRIALSLSLPAKHTDAGLRLALRCALSPSEETSHVSNARLALRQRLSPRKRELRLQAEVASLVAPVSPGLVAPFSSIEHLASIDEAGLRVAAQEPGEVQIAVVGPLNDPSAWLPRVVHEVRMQSLMRATGEAPKRLVPEQALPVATHGTTGALKRLDEGAVLLVLRSAGGDPGADAGAQAAALVLRTIVAKTMGIACTWHAGGVAGPWGWAAVAMELPAALPEDFASRLNHHLHTLGPAMIAEAVTHLYGQQRMSWSTERATVEGEARALAGVGPNPSNPSRASALALAQRLLTETQGIVWEQDAAATSASAVAP